MTWRQQYDKDYQVRNRRGNRFFVKTNDPDNANETALLGRQRVVWKWSVIRSEYIIQENPCSENPPSRL